MTTKPLNLSAALAGIIWVRMQENLDTEHWSFELQRSLMHEVLVREKRPEAMPCSLLELMTNTLALWKV